jgi:large subunit ribosomal protein L18
MKRSRNLVLPHRRKREGKTDYKVRLRLLKSRKPRFVVRKSLNNIICQIVKFDPEGDKVVVSANSKELKKFGWKFHCGNIPSAYLTGFLCAEKAKKHKVSEVILDLGLYESTPGNRLYSALRGAIDGGLEIPHSEDILPKPERVSGQHISQYAEKLKKENPSRHKKVFSSYLKSKADPKEMPKVFEHAKKKISGVKERKEHEKTKSKKEK